MTTSIASLKGINVGGKNKLPMADLRALFEQMGFSHVQTLIQSGNVVFHHDKSVSRGTIEKAIATEFSITTHAIVRSAAQLKRVLRNNPYEDFDTQFVHFGFADSVISAATAAEHDFNQFAPEEITIKKDQIYFFLPGGMGNSKLAEFAIRRLKVPITVRNWNTVNKLVALSSS